MITLEQAKALQPGDKLESSRNQIEFTVVSVESSSPDKVYVILQVGNTQTYITEKLLHVVSLIPAKVEQEPTKEPEPLEDTQPDTADLSSALEESATKNVHTIKRTPRGKK